MEAGRMYGYREMGKNYRGLWEVRITDLGTKTLYAKKEFARKADMTKEIKRVLNHNRKINQGGIPQ